MGAVVGCGGGGVVGGGVDNTKQVTNNELQQQQHQQNIIYIMATFVCMYCIYVIVLSIYISTRSYDNS